MMISGLLLAVLMVIAVWIIAFYGFSSHNLLILLGLVVAPIGVFLLNNPALWFVAILGIRESGLIIPGLPQGLQLVHVMIAGFIVLIVARTIIGGGQKQKVRAAMVSMFVFLGIVLVTIIFRGIGLRALGSSQWGGMGYVYLMISAGLLITSRYVVLSSRQWEIAIIMMVLFSFLPAISQIIFLVSGGKIYQQYMFIEAHVTGLLGSLDAAETGHGVFRLQLFRHIADNLIIAVIVFIPFRGIKRLFVVCLIVLCFILAGLSGFRSSIVGLAGWLFIYVMLTDANKRVKRLVQTAVIVGILLVVVIPFASSMPNPVQRAVSWIPLVQVDPRVKMDAMNSIDWRIEIWKMAWSQIHNYLLLGKGLTLDPAVMTYYSARADSVLGAFLTHNYHNGPISLLMDFGFFGFMSVTAFFIFSGTEILKNIRNIRGNPTIVRFYFFSAAIYIYRAFSFYFVFGDMDSISMAFVSLAILYGISATLKLENEMHMNKDARSKTVFVPKAPRINPFDHPDI